MAHHHHLALPQFMNKGGGIPEALQQSGTQHQSQHAYTRREAVEGATMTCCTASWGRTSSADDDNTWSIFYTLSSVVTLPAGPHALKTGWVSAKLENIIVRGCQTPDNQRRTQTVTLEPYWLIIHTKYAMAGRDRQNRMSLRTPSVFGSTGCRLQAE